MKSSIFYLNFNLVESFTTVDTDNTTNHFRNNDHVTEMGLNNGGLVLTSGLSLGLADLLDQSHRLTLQTTDHAATSTAVNELNELHKN